jgi:hypothetical protein
MMKIIMALSIIGLLLNLITGSMNAIAAGKGSELREEQTQKPRGEGCFDFADRPVPCKQLPDKQLPDEKCKKPTATNCGDPAVYCTEAAFAEWKNWKECLSS